MPTDRGNSAFATSRSSTISWARMAVGGRSSTSSSEGITRPDDVERDLVAVDQLVVERRRKYVVAPTLVSGTKRIRLHGVCPYTPPELEPHVVVAPEVDATVEARDCGLLGHRG